MNPRDQKVTVQIEQSNHAWLWRERRRRERSIAWIVNQAITQYRERLERPKGKRNGSPKQSKTEAA
jgi:hypothetical protein